MKPLLWLLYLSSMITTTVSSQSVFHAIHSEEEFDYIDQLNNGDSIIINVNWACFPDYHHYARLLAYVQDSHIQIEQWRWEGLILCTIHKPRCHENNPDPEYEFVSRRLANEEDFVNLRRFQAEIEKKNINQDLPGCGAVEVTISLTWTNRSNRYRFRDYHWDYSQYFGRN